MTANMDEHYTCTNCETTWPCTVDGARAAADHERQHDHYVDVTTMVQPGILRR